MSEKEWIEPSSSDLGFLVREGTSLALPTVVMLHGWSGDEKGMWVFEAVLPDNWWIAAPRGLYPLAAGGYNWVPGTPSNRSTLSEFDPAVDALLRMLESFGVRSKRENGELVLMGFSQGAALAFATAARTAVQPAAIVSLAGFLPQGDLQNLRGNSVFWGHGVRDPLVPVEMARQGVARLEGFGAEVHYCEADVAHKVGIECARGLKTWLTQQLAR